MKSLFHQLNDDRFAKTDRFWEGTSSKTLKFMFKVGRYVLWLSSTVSKRIM
jgi:hypothetical protein